MMDNREHAVDGQAAPQDDEAKLVVILDTDPGVRWALARGLERSGYQVEASTTAGEALNVAYQRPVAAVVMELLPEAGLTMDVVSLFLDTPCAPRVICVSVDAEPQGVIECMRRGAADFLPKPFTLADVRAALTRALSSGSGQRIAPGSEPVREVPDGSSMLIGISPAMQELRETIKQVARTDLNCLLRGDSGTGKDMVAREIHRHSERRDRAFVKVNCTALPDQLLESELFGYEKGAFTGAVTAKPGRFQLAHHGIIFLDEIGDMHPSLQAKLLQVIEHKEFTKLGGRRHVTVDVQIIAATNADLELKTRNGSFRDDLYFRLNEVCVWVPPLSGRKEDVPLLVRHFIRKHGRFMGDTVFDISGEDLESLTKHDWPGNVRELESTIKRWLALGKKVYPVARSPRSPGETPPIGGTGPAAPTAPLPVPEPTAPHPPPREPGQVGGEDGVPEGTRILDALERFQWNRRKAAEALGMSYQTLRRRIEKFGLNQRS
jgi:two-component system, NtrC family, response regulator AtoC